MRTKPIMITHIISRIVSTTAILTFAVGCATAQTTGDPLPSWNDGATKKAITEFVAKTTKAVKTAAPAKSSPYNSERLMTAWTLC